MGSDPVATHVKETQAIREILQQACDRRELLILVTPFLRFESGFIAIEKQEMHVAATMSREEALYGLRSPELIIRFPHAMGFFEGPVQVLGLGMFGGNHTLRLSLPKALKENDQRTAYRVERVGRVEVTFSTERAEIYTATLMDLSLGGVRLHLHRDLQEGLLTPGDQILADIPLSTEIQLRTHARIRHVRGRSMGIEFEPKLPLNLKEPLARWVFLRREEERERIANRKEGQKQGERRGAGLPARAVVMVSSDEALERELREALTEDITLVRVSPAVQALKETIQQQPLLYIFHIACLRLDEKRRLKTLVEMVQRRAPILLLGNTVDGSLLFELAGEWKAQSALSWNPARGLFFQRLLRGMIRRHLDLEDVPMAPPQWPDDGEKDGDEAGRGGL